MEFIFDRSKHVFHSPEFEELIKDMIRFFSGTPIQPLPPLEPFDGAGVYALYFIGHSDLYEPLYAANRTSFNLPIYVGKAVPRGWHQGRKAESRDKELYNRLMDHTKSITQVTNLEVGDFFCRFMILEDGASSLIGTVEASLIRHYLPIWNCLVDGFGNHDPGKGRYEQAQSDWDRLHPGRRWASKCVPSTKPFRTTIILWGHGLKQCVSWEMLSR